jgi:hypothetical protein
VDAEAIDGEPSIRELLRIYDAHSDQRLNRLVAERYAAEGKAIPSWTTPPPGEEVSTLDALKAGDRLAKLINGWRWILIRQAREEGKTWTQIGDALAMTKQGAYDYYRNAVDRQEQYAPEFSRHHRRAPRAVQGAPDE